MAPRVILFVDYQNVYRAARAAFCSSDAPAREGQVDPARLGELVTSRRPAGELIGVRIYRGQPDSRKEPRGSAIVERQCSVWRGLPRVVVFTRPLRYPRDWPKARPMEKGIDVALSVDFVLMAARGEYDVGIVMSTDTDLIPALEAVIALGGARFPRCEVAAWSTPRSHSPRLAIPGRRIWCHWLDEHDYLTVADRRNYSHT